MNQEILYQFVHNPQESAKLDFKSQMYRLKGDESQKQWNELIKDVIAITNGNIDTSRETGYLIIGADEKLDSNGKPTLANVDYSSLPPDKDIHDKINTYVHPRIANIEFVKFNIDGYSLWAIVISPSPYLHRLSKQLKPYSEHSVLLRRGNGEDTYPASDEEKEVMRWERKKALPHNSEQSDRPKSSLDVYDRKIAIYKITREFLRQVIQEGGIKDIPSLVKFGIDTDEAIFLFDKEVEDYLRNIYMESIRLYGMYKKMNNSHFPVEEERLELIDQYYQLLSWFDKQRDFIRDLFSSYISL